LSQFVTCVVTMKGFELGTLRPQPLFRAIKFTLFGSGKISLDLPREVGLAEVELRPGAQVP